MLRKKLNMDKKKKIRTQVRTRSSTDSSSVFITLNLSMSSFSFHNANTSSFFFISFSQMQYIWGIYFFIMVKLAKHKIYHFKHFRVWNSMAFSTFTMFCNCHHTLVSWHFHHPKRRPYPFSDPFPYSSPWPLATASLLSLRSLFLFSLAHSIQPTSKENQSRTHSW